MKKSNRKPKGKPKEEPRYQGRVDVVAAVQRGESIQVVARVFGVPLRTVFDWLCKYRHGGWHALRDRTRSGRHRKLNVKLMMWLYDAITLGDPRQYQMPFCLWTINKNNR